tara:strand:- start:471 stop:797 length:327 start_codon:yes stop_codon:yes gene_type:complete
VEVLVLPDVSQTPTIRCDFGFCCIGVYTGVPEAKFREIEVGLNTKAAEAMKAGGARRCCYLSGAGVTGTGIVLKTAKVRSIPIGMEQALPAPEGVQGRLSRGGGQPRP